MTKKIPRSKDNFRLLLLIGSLFLGGFFFFSLAHAAKAQETQGKNLSSIDQSAEDCLACHNQPGQTYALPSGETVSTTISQQDYGLSIHGSQGMACSDCHAGYTGYPHLQRTAHGLREYVIQHEEICIQCHTDKYEQLKDSVHYTVLSDGNQNAPVCSDCHNPHAQSQSGKSALEMELALTSQVCAKCHNGIYVEYAQSIHGVGLFQENNPDVPTCADCHGVHSIEDPRTTKARLDSPQLCAGCHTNPAIMDKYDLSTDVLKTYVADFHGTTVTIFDKLNPDQETNKPVCYDCHGVHNIRAVDDPQKGIEVKANLLLTCQKCHPEATINLPDSWLSHYIPSRERSPLVYYVNQFYKVFIPLVLGGMALFVISDLGRRIWDKISARQKPKQPRNGK